MVCDFTARKRKPSQLPTRGASHHVALPVLCMYHVCAFSPKDKWVIRSTGLSGGMDYGHGCLRPFGRPTSKGLGSG
uniref:Uncharacterized protein n=1 Tax=Nelumbo nucifera TaxID=4432 RepID=A0A822YT48_NELNU|nr:TPA_asm: hypothetical protein HUJ06_005371 [Nelumbo nucifera]